MMSGEFDYADIFYNTEDNLPVPFKLTSYTLFIVLFILLSIITLNLLIGLTVDDIKSFLDEADMKNLKLKLRYVLEIEKFYTKYLPGFLKFSKVQNFTLTSKSR